MAHTSLKSVVFGGDPEHINLGNIHSFIRTTPFSVSVWFKTTTDTGTALTLIDKQMPATASTGWGIFLDADEEVNFYIFNDFAASNRLQVKAESWWYGELRDGKWHHVVVTWDGDVAGGTNGAHIYLDGVDMGAHGRLTVLHNSLTAPDVASTADLNIGRRPWGYGYFIGNIDDVSIWDRELTEAEAIGLWSNREPNDAAGLTPSPNLVGWWKMGDMELSGYSPLTTSIQIGTDGSGDQNEAAIFPDPIALPATGQPFTMGCWVKGGTSGRTMLHKTRSGTGRQWGLWIVFSPSRVEASWSDNSYDRNYRIFGGGATVLDGSWHHVVWTYDGVDINNFGVYVDGVSQTPGGGGSQSGGFSTPGSDGSFAVGAIWRDISVSNAYYLGRLCHSFLYNKVLNAGEVGAIYNGGQPPDLTSVGPTANLKHWSALGDGCALGAGNMVDLSGEGNHGTFFSGESNDFVLDVPGSPSALKDWQTQIATTVAGGVSDYSYDTNNGTPTNMEDADFADAILASEKVSDLSGNGYVGTPTNMENADFVTDTPGGRSRRSSLFDGVNEYITMGNVLGFEYTNPFSVSCWFKMSGTGADTLVSKQDNSTNRGWIIFLNAGELNWQLVNGSGVRIAIKPSGTFNDGSWHHAVCTYSADTPGAVADMVIYVDGVAQTPVVVEDTLGSNTILTSASLNIGARDDGAGLHYAGNIDDVTIYDRALTLAEVQDVYNSGLPRDNRLLSSASNIVGYWLMGDLTAGGCSHFATRFDGVNEYVTMGNVLGFERTDPFSVSVWIKYTPNGSDMWLVSKKDTGQPGWNLGIGPTGFIKFELFNTYPTNWMQAYVAISFGDDVWHHVVATWDGDVSPGRAGANIYVDGIAQSLVGASDTLTGSIVNTTDLEIGARETGTAGNFEGVIDQVAVYARELTAIEAAALYNNGVPIDVTAAIDRTDLVGYWRMGEGDGNPSTLANGGAIATDSPITSYTGNGVIIDVDGSDSLGVNIDGTVIDIDRLGWASDIAGASIEVVMQAVDSVTGDVYTWTVPVPDFAGERYPGPNNPTQIAIRAVKGFP